MEPAVLPDGRVSTVDRGTSQGGGQVRICNPATKNTTEALGLDLAARHEDSY
ncbi:hypothetical protein [Streptomyces enissocaesilis]|uniref:Uncharacterized protein n=1 Tax=Streptomyces enissocaesilis TaxID=332589 RepID=A0ABP6JS99_9ACTN